MTTVDAGMVVRSMQPEDEPTVLALLTAAMGDGPAGGRTEDFFRWKHHASPFGPSPGLVAVENGRLIGVRLFLRWELEFAGRRLSAVRAVDTATHPDFRGRGIFRTLTLDLLRRLEDAGEVDLVFNTPNGNSKPGYLKMGWREVGTLPVHVGVARPVRFLRGLRSANAATATSRRTPPRRPGAAKAQASIGLPTAAEVLPSLSPRLEQLLDEASPPSGLHTPRTIDYLTWRYADAPGLDYRCVALGTADRLDGLVIGRIRPRGSLTELTLSELLVREGDATSARRLLSASRRSGADHVVAHLSRSEDRRAAARASFLPAPRAGLSLVANPRTSLPFDPFDLRSWDLSLGDLEVF